MVVIHQTYIWFGVRAVSTVQTAQFGVLFAGTGLAFMSDYI